MKQSPRYQIWLFAAMAVWIWILGYVVGLQNGADRIKRDVSDACHQEIARVRAEMRPAN